MTMAGLWVKWEVGLPRKPEILQIARRLKMSPPEAAGRCMLVWEWADSATESGEILGVGRETIDGIAGIEGMCAAMEATRPHPWIMVDDTGVTFTNYDRHNGDCAKRRAEDAFRKRADRSRTKHGRK